MNVVAAAVVVLAAGVITQLARGAWPFPPRSSDEVAAPAAQPAVVPPPAPTPPATTPPSVMRERTAPAGMATATADVRRLTRPAYAYGAVALDETRTAHVLAGTSGQVDRLAVEMVGRTVKAGDTLCTVGGKAVTSPRSGVVVMKAADVGMTVEPTTELYTVADVSRMWILVDVREADLPFVHVGDRARLTIARRRGTLDATIAYLAPTPNTVRNTLKARFEIANRDRALRPGALVTAELPLALGPGLVVPTSAIARDGDRTLVLVVRDQRLEPRDVVLGPESGKLVRVERGLAIGETVALDAQPILEEGD